MTDKGGELLLKRLSEYPNLKKLDIHYNYLSEQMVRNLEGLPLEVDASERNEAEEYRGEVYMNAMLTE